MAQDYGRRRQTLPDIFESTISGIVDGHNPPSNWKLGDRNSKPIPHSVQHDTKLLRLSFGSRSSLYSRRSVECSKIVYERVDTDLPNRVPRTKRFDLPLLMVRYVNGRGRRRNELTWPLELSRMLDGRPHSWRRSSLMSTYVLLTILRIL